VNLLKVDPFSSSEALCIIDSSLMTALVTTFGSSILPCPTLALSLDTQNILHGSIASCLATESTDGGMSQKEATSLPSSE
jgi:hypothetical protein